MKGLIYFCTIIILCSSCSKKILKDQLVYKISTPQTGTPRQFVTVYKTDSCASLSLIPVADYYITNIGLSDLDSITSYPLQVSTSNLDKQNYYYFPEPTYINVSQTGFAKKLVYREGMFSLQPFAFTMKIRPKLEIPRDSFPMTVSTGLNIGIAPGYKFTRTKLKTNANFFGEKIERYSANCGLLINIGAEDLNASNTSPDIQFARKAPVLSFGIYGSLGINKFNLGIGIGKDYVLGEGHDVWVYRKEYWYGILVALDITK